MNHKKELLRGLWVGVSTRLIRTLRGILIRVMLLNKAEAHSAQAI